MRGVGSPFTPAMNNACVFSADRRHRYSLIHRWDDLLTPPKIIAHKINQIVFNMPLIPRAVSRSEIMTLSV